jgi:hypothetical protein
LAWRSASDQRCLFSPQPSRLQNVFWGKVTNVLKDSGITVLPCFAIGVQSRLSAWINFNEDLGLEARVLKTQIEPASA